MAVQIDDNKLKTIKIYDHVRSFLRRTNSSVCNHGNII